MLDVGSEQHVRLPELIAELRFELLASRRGQQLLFGKALLFEETVQGGSGDVGSIRAGTQAEFTQKCGPRAMGIFALEASDEVGQLRCDGARLAAISAYFGSEGFEPAAAIALNPNEERVDRNRPACGIGNVVKTRGNLFGASRELSARDMFQD